MAFEIVDDDNLDSNNEESDTEILEVARRRFHEAEEAEASIRIEALDDLRFVAGDQWPDDVRVNRDMDKRPCLTINRLPGYIKQVTNDQRQNPTGVKVDPIDGEADEDTAEIFEGMIRHIEQISNATSAYETAFEGAVRNSFGYYRIITDYANEKSFDQEIFVKRIRDPFSVYFDPNAQEPDGSDADWAFIIESLSRDEYKNKYPDTDLSNMADWVSVGDAANGWATADTARVAEYFCKTYKKKTLCLLSDGSSIFKEDYPELPLGITVIKEREVLAPKIMWYKINGVEILERTEWLGKWIPIVPVLGDELIVEGERKLISMIRYAKDPQRMYNYWESAKTEMIALAPRAPFIGAEGQFEGHEESWKTANTKNHPYLQYKMTDLGGKPAPPPQRQTIEPAVQAITEASMQTIEDMKSTTGVYDPALGKGRPDQSGIAIQRLTTQSQVGNFNFVDNLNRSIRHGGRIFIDLIPKVYDTARAGRILREDGTTEIVKLNEVFQEGGQNKMYDLDKGLYDVAVAAGPSYATKRQEAVAAILDLVKSFPPIMQSCGDILVGNMDWSGAQQIAERLKKTLPPNLQEDDKKQSPIPPQAQAQMAQMSQMIQQLHQELSAATNEIQTKKPEIASKERIEMAKLKMTAAIELAKINSKEGQALLEHQVGSIQHRLDLLNDNQPVENNPSAGPQGMAPGQNQQQPSGAQALR